MADSTTIFGNVPTCLGGHGFGNTTRVIATNIFTPETKIFRQFGPLGINRHMPAVRANSLDVVCGCGVKIRTVHNSCPIIQKSREGVFNVLWQIVTGHRHTCPVTQMYHFAIRVMGGTHILSQPALVSYGHCVIYVSVIVWHCSDILARICKIGVIFNRNRIVSATKSQSPLGQPAVVSIPTVNDFNGPNAIYRTANKLGEGLVWVIHLGHVDRVG